MNSILDHLEKLTSLRTTNLGNLGLLNAETNPDGSGNSIQLTGVVRDDTGALVYVEEDGSTTQIQTVEATTGFARFVFNVSGAFPLIADSAKDSVNFNAGQGIKVETDPSSDTMTWSVDPTTFLTTVGSGASILNPAGELRTITTGDNLTVTALTDELRFEVDHSAVTVGSGETSLNAGLDATGKLALRSFLNTNSVRFEIDGDVLKAIAIPALEAEGSGFALNRDDGDVSKIRTLGAGANINIQQDLDGGLTINSQQQYNQTGAGNQLFTGYSANVLEVKTLKAGPRVLITQDTDDSLVFQADTSIVSVGAGVPLGFVTNGVGQIRSIKAGAGIQITQNSLDLDLQADMRVDHSGDGIETGTLNSDGSLTLKNLKAADNSVFLAEDSGNITIRGNPDDYILNATLQNALDGSGDEYHFVINTNRGTTIDAGPIPFVRAFAVPAVNSDGDPIQEIHIYNRNSFVGKLPLDHPENSFVASLEGDLGNDMSGISAWDTTDDLSDPPNQIIHIDLGA